MQYVAPQPGDLVSIGEYKTLCLTSPKPRPGKLLYLEITVFINNEVGIIDFLHPNINENNSSDVLYHLNQGSSFITTRGKLSIIERFKDAVG